ncbi:MAG TPA: hypothetical protein VHV74_05360 [Pseudonocardiaceae bacterium]|nr:hypothetical protein [Pseudonocardiaceae bacterium]
MRRSVPGLVAVVVGVGLALAGCQIPNGKGVPGNARTSQPVLPSVGAPSWRMPNLVGTGLQKAQDGIQHLTGDGIFFTSSHDVTGRGRHQIVDSDWRVCSQNVRAGATITIGSKIDFGVVKLGENCP